MRLLFVILALFSLTGCAEKFWVRKIDSAEATRAVQLYAQKMKYEQRLRLEDSCVYYDTYIHRFRMDFTTQEILDLCQARRLLVDVVDGFLTTINANPALVADHGGHYTEADLELVILPESFYSEYVDPNRVGMITMRCGISHFFDWQTLKPERDYWQKRQEFFWQSRLFVEYEREGEELYKPKINERKKEFPSSIYIPTE